MANMLMNVLCFILSLCSLAAARDLEIYGCSGRGFTGECHTFKCGYQDCCVLPAFFKTRLVSVRSVGYNLRLFTDAGCKYHCNDNDNGSRFVDNAGWNNIGAAAYACVDGPF
ncbi:hypothetical protein PWT90_10589 [Aphanocladium album]|nr:hypothetical protein PWT90_10589 [Aphanocladium album]